MALKVIGSGFGRTGTRSLKDALEALGFAPCHHMADIFPNPAQGLLWQRVLTGEIRDWDQVFSGFAAQIDWPGAHVWRELAAAYPQAKVLHSTRPEEKWWASFSQTIGKLMTHRKSLPLPPHVRGVMDAMAEHVLPQTFGGDWMDKDRAIAALRRREAEVRAAIPADRLLVYDVAEGWGPLCAFLNVPVPDLAFPNTNQKEGFWERFGGEPA